MISLCVCVPSDHNFTLRVHVDLCVMPWHLVCVSWRDSESFGCPVKNVTYSTASFHSYLLPVKFFTVYLEVKKFMIYFTRAAASVGRSVSKRERERATSPSLLVYLESILWPVTGWKRTMCCSPEPKCDRCVDCRHYFTILDRHEIGPV